jgi:hypothetical protein
MSEEESISARIVAEIKTWMRDYSFTHIASFGEKTFILYRPPGSGSHKDIETRISALASTYDKRVNCEWSESNYERLSVNLIDPGDVYPDTQPHFYPKTHAYFPSDKADRTISRLVPEIVKGKIGALVAGRTRVFVPKSDNEDVYVTLQNSDEYIECDATELPEGVKIYYGSPVLVDKINRVIVSSDA